MKNYKNTDYLKRIKAIEERLDKLESKVLISKHEFKVGDRVQFKTWEEMETEFKNDYIDLSNDMCFIDRMKHLCSTYATIAKIYENGEVDLENFTATGDTYWNYSLGMLKPAVNEPKWTFTEDEKVILRNLPKEYRWITRDKDDVVYCKLHCWTKKPEKDKRWDGWDNPQDVQLNFIMFEHLFQSIKWEDAEPCEFRKYL